MTVQSEVARVSYVGDGVQTEFAVPYYFLADDHLKLVVAVGGVETIPELNTDYTVSGAGVEAGGEVVFTTAPVNNAAIAIILDPPVTQLTSYNDQDPFPAASHERALDKLTQIDLRQEEQLARAPKFSETSGVTGVTIEQGTDGQIPVWDSDGNLSPRNGVDIGTAAFASQAEAEAGTSDSLLMSPLRTKQSIASEVGDTVQAFDANLDTLSSGTTTLGTTGLALLEAETDDNAWTVLGDVTTVRLADGAATTAKLADDAVTTDKVADDTVTRPLVAPNIRPTIPITPLEHGAVFDGVTDDTSAVLAAANAAIAAGLPLYLPPGAGLVGDISTIGALRIIGAPGATLQALPGSLHLWNFDGGGGLVHLDGVTLDCDNQTGMDHISQFVNGRGALVHCEGRNFLWDTDGSTKNAFRMESTLTAFRVDGGYYHDIIGTNEVFRNNCNNAVYTGVHIQECSWHGIRFGACSYGRVVGCFVEDFSRGWGTTLPAAAGGAAYIMETGTVRTTIMGNIARNGRQLVKCDGGSRQIIKGNTGLEPAGIIADGQGIQVLDTHNSIIEGNHLESYDLGINVTGTSTRASVLNNWLFGIGTHGISTAAGSTVIVGNQVRNSGDIGIRLTSASVNCMVRSNAVTGSGTTDISDLGTTNSVAGNN